MQKVELTRRPRTKDGLSRLGERTEEEVREAKQAQQDVCILPHAQNTVHCLVHSHMRAGRRPLFYK